MSRDYEARLGDVLAAIHKIGSYIDGIDIATFKQDDLIIDAVNMNLMIIGEAANNIPDEVQQKYPEVDWRNIIGLRNVITHEYFRLNLDRIWDITQNVLPDFREQIAEVLEKEQQTEEESSGTEPNTHE